MVCCSRKCFCFFSAYPHFQSLMLLFLSTICRILLSTPLAVTSYFLVWYIPPFVDGKVIWCIFFYCIFQTLQTCFHVPYSALTMFITSEQKERDSATAYRMTVEVLGSLLGTAIQGQIVGMAHAPCLPGPGEIVADPTNYSAFVSQNESDHSISLQHTRTAYMIASAVICSVYILCAVVLFCGVREHEATGNRSKPMPFLQGIKMVMGYGPYAKLVMGFLFTSLAFMLLEGNFALFCTSTLGFRNNFQNILLVIMLSATLAIPFWQWFLTRFGKKTAAFVGSMSAIPFVILVVCMKSNLIIIYIVSCASGVAVAAAFLLPWSMLPDVVDDFQVRNPNSTGHEAIFYSFYVFFTKFASGISLGVSTLSLDFAGYVTSGCSQPEEVDLTLKLLVSAVPVVLIFIGLGILYTYPINEERRQGNRKILQEMRTSVDKLYGDAGFIFQQDVAPPCTAKAVMSANAPGQGFQNKTRVAILAELDKEKRRLLQSQSMNSPGANIPLSARSSLKEARDSAEQQHIAAQQKAALQHAHVHSSGFFITQDSSFGNLILPVLPRLEPDF
ncbi:Sodium-dependent lysophosphatidylcholine symporter 1-B [Ilyodon furcidens]|uniref:SOSS complex subunit C n=5 Tax=Goodeidae TaxID=28758 RepID=A0ABV0SHP3_9TELE